MKEFKKYILDNHPDPDVLVGNLGVFNQMIKLAEDYAQSKVENLGLADVRLSLIDKIKESVFGRGSALDRIVEIKGLINNEA